MPTRAGSANLPTCAPERNAVRHDERDDSRHWRGYLRYHQQDTESLVESSDGSVYLGYGAYPPDRNRGTRILLTGARWYAAL